jgi:hypothetical protein
MSPDKCSACFTVRAARQGRSVVKVAFPRPRFTARQLAWSVAALGAFLLNSPARAEVVTLADNTQVMGKLTHYFDGLIVLETTNGQKLELPREKVKQIVFQLPPARTEFSTPEKTFDRWRSSMLKGESGKAIDCYALMYQGMVGQQLAQSPDQFKQAQKDLEGVQFSFLSTSFQKQGEQRLATLKVRRTKGDNVQTDEIHLVLENGEWKMTP